MVKVVTNVVGGGVIADRSPLKNVPFKLFWPHITPEILLCSRPLLRNVRNVMKGLPPLAAHTRHMYMYLT